MQRISVDLPEPEGPQMTIFSPWSTVRLMFSQDVELAVPLVDADHLDGRSFVRCRLQAAAALP